MASNTTSIHIGLYGRESAPNPEERGCGLWPVGCTGAVSAAGGTPVPLPESGPGSSWEDMLNRVDALLFVGSKASTARQRAQEERLCESCRELRMPFLGIDGGLHILNTTFGGTVFLDLPRELPHALQHCHPPEKGLRHAITVDRGTRLAKLYGEGEIVVNSEHRTAVSQVARGFRVSARALDGVIEAIEPEDDDWYALGVQWNPASATASGLDIQVFRGLVEACRPQRKSATRAACRQVA